MDRFYHGDDVLFGCLGEDAVPEVEDVSGPASSRVQDRRHAFFNLLRRPKQRRRIQVPLDPHLVAEPFPGLVEVDAPIDPDNITAGCLHEVKDTRVSRGEVDSRGLCRERVQDPLAVGEDELLVVVGGEAAGPAVKKLYNGRARLYLGVEVGDDDRAQFFHEAMPAAGVLIHQGLGADKIPRASSLDEVARQGKGRAGKADHGDCPLELAADRSYGLHDKGEVLCRPRWA